MKNAPGAKAYLQHTTSQQTLVRTLGLAGLVLVVGGTAIGLRGAIARPPDLGTGPLPAHVLTMYATDAKLSTASPSFGSVGAVSLRFEGAYLAAYPRMEASELDAKFAIFAKPHAGDCCWQPKRISWQNVTAAGEVAVPIAYAPFVRNDVANVTFPSLDRIDVTSNDAAALKPLLLSHVPLVATIDVGSPDAPRLFDLRPASDAEIARHQHVRYPAARS